jgi:hypothetical protein
MLKSILATICIVSYFTAFAISCGKKTGQFNVEARENQDTETNQRLSYDTTRPAQKKENNTLQLPSHLSHIFFKGGDGRNCENAIKIENARNTAEGVEAAKVWIEANYPGSQRIEHAIAKQDGRIVEAFKLKTKDGDTINICFDVTSFFGNW